MKIQEKEESTRKRLPKIFFALIDIQKTILRCGGKRLHRNPNRFGIKVTEASLMKLADQLISQ